LSIAQISHNPHALSALAFRVKRSYPVREAFPKGRESPPTTSPATISRGINLKSKI